jgi:hypothetical protein
MRSACRKKALDTDVARLHMPLASQASFHGLAARLDWDGYEEKND